MDLSLSGFVFANRKRAFSYGDWDCVQMAGELLEVRGAHNPYSKYKGTYSTEMGAYRIIKRESGDVDTFLHLGFSPSNAVGDIGLIDDGACVLITGPRHAVGLGVIGWKYVPVAKIIKRFECPKFLAR